jgi:hypothetical protein
MKIKKYRPSFFEGFEDEYYTVNSKEELLSCELCKGWIDQGFEICFALSYCEGSIMAIKQAENENGATWYVVSNVYGKQTIDALLQWLPDWDLKRKEYKNKLNKQ